MKKCKAFYPIAGTRKAWIPCLRRAEPGSLFCLKHGDAIVGALLGLFVAAEPVDEVEPVCGTAERDNAETQRARR
jgi:hypothetical protein